MVCQRTIVADTIGINGLNVFWVCATIGPDGFTMVFEQATIGPDGFSMVANHWSNDGSIIMDRKGLPSNVASLYFALKVFEIPWPFPTPIFGSQIFLICLQLRPGCLCFLLFISLTVRVRIGNG